MRQSRLERALEIEANTWQDILRPETERILKQSRVCVVNRLETQQVCNDRLKLSSIRVDCCARFSIERRTRLRPAAALV